MELKYYITATGFTGAQSLPYIIHRPDDTEVCSFGSPEIAQNLCDELNKALHMLPATVTYSVQEEAEHLEKPKKKRIPRVLRPTVTLPEQEWAAVHSVLRIQGRTDITNAADMLGYLDPNPAIDKIKRGLHDIRLAEHIKAQVDAYCDAIRNPTDEDEPF